MDDPEGSEEEDEQVLTVDGEARHQPVHRLHLVRLVLHLDDVEDGGLVVRTEDTAGDLPEELLHDAGDGVEGVVLDVDESSLQWSVSRSDLALTDCDHYYYYYILYLLQKMNEFLHACLMTRGTENFLLEGALLVQLQQHHLEIAAHQDGAPPPGLS